MDRSIFRCIPPPNGSGASAVIFLDRVDELVDTEASSTEDAMENNPNQFVLFTQPG
jgi:hypothetical protein